MFPKYHGTGHSAQCDAFERQTHTLRVGVNTDYFYLLQLNKQLSFVIGHGCESIFTLLQTIHTNMTSI